MKQLFLEPENLNKDCSYSKQEVIIFQQLSYVKEFTIHGKDKPHIYCHEFRNPNKQTIASENTLISNRIRHI